MIWGKIIQKLLIILPQIILPSKTFAFLARIELVKKSFSLCLRGGLKISRVQCCPVRGTPVSAYLKTGVVY